MDHDDVDILLVEDTDSDAELAIRALRKRGLANKLVWLNDGAKALDFIFAAGEYASRNADNHPKVILLDLRLPKVSGIEVLRRIKGDPRARNIPVVVVTSSKEDIDLQECYALGVNSYISKPVEFDQFTKAVGDLGFYWLLVNRRPG
ncbi:MAG TPA: response regulator [Nevskia sp.]|nr:response regulator [Nevskia sp.]